MPNLFSIHFDGGDVADFAYGSWEIEYNGFKKRVHRESYKGIERPYLIQKLVTNNVAEYLALIGALEWLQSVKNKKEYPVEIFGDSLLVVNQVRGLWRSRKHLTPLTMRVRELVSGFQSWTIEWRRRDANVARFGH